MNRNDHTLPSGWKKLRLDQVSRIVGGSTPSTDRTEFWDGTIAWTTPKDLSNLEGPYLDGSSRKITEAGLQSCASEILPANSVLFSSRAPIGLVAINRVPMATNQGFKSFIPYRDVADAKYLYHWLKTNRSYLDSLGNGATFKEVSKAIVSRVELPVPPLSEQKRLAAILDHADAIRRKRQQALRLTDDFLRSVFLDMFGTSEAPKCSRTSLSDHLEFITSGGRGWAQYYSEEGDKFIRSLDVQMNEINDTEMIRVRAPKNAEADRTRIRVGDVLLTITGSLIGRVAPVTETHEGAFISQHVAILRMREINPEFASYALSSEECQQQIARNQTGQTKPGLNFDQIRRITIPQPSKAAEELFSKILKVRRKTLNSQRRACAEAETLFQSLQHRAFTGQL